MSAGEFNGNSFGAGRAPGSLARRFSTIAAVLLAVAVTGMEAHSQEIVAGDLVIEQPWARATPAGAKVAGGYLVIRNTGETADRLLSGSAPFAERLEVHEVSLVDGVSGMRHLPDGLEIPPGGEVSLEPGSYHLMFVGIEEPLTVDTVVTGTLTFERAGSVEVEFAVASIGAARPSGHGAGSSPDAGHGAGHDMGHGSGH